MGIENYLISNNIALVNTNFFLKFNSQSQFIWSV